MSEGRSYSGSRGLAFVIAAIALVTIIAAVVNTPLSEWSTINYIFGAVIVFFAGAYLVAGFRGGFNLTGRAKPKTTFTLSIIGSIAALIVIASSTFAGDWNQDTILTTGLWLALLVMFLAGAVQANKQMKASN